MATTDIVKLKKKYETICEQYIEIFSKKQEVEFTGWVGGTIGETATFNDEAYFSFNDIVYDVNTKQPNGLILMWQSDSIEHQGKSINYYSYSKGLRYKDL